MKVISKRRKLRTTVIICLTKYLYRYIIKEKLPATVFRKEKKGMQKKIKKISNFAQSNCNKCELRAACWLANADWHKAMKDYPCFQPVPELTKQILNEEIEMKIKKISMPITVGLAIVTVLAILLIILQLL